MEEPKSITIDGHKVNCKKKANKTTKFHGGQKDRNCKSLVEEVVFRMRDTDAEFVSKLSILSSIGTWKVVHAMTIARKVH
jgi:hypothetical protein